MAGTTTAKKPTKPVSPKSANQRKVTPTRGKIVSEDGEKIYRIMGDFSANFEQEIKLVGGEPRAIAKGETKLYRANERYRGTEFGTKLQNAIDRGLIELMPNETETTAELDARLNPPHR